MFPGPLRAFHEAVQAGSIRKASEKLGLAPSSVSRQIAILEHLMGTALFNRSLGGVELTHAGALVAEYAKATVPRLRHPAHRPRRTEGQSRPDPRGPGRECRLQRTGARRRQVP
jgi:DNA-binding transcriptional LysR family regulator